MDAKLLEILVCPLCKGPLIHDREAHDDAEIDHNDFSNKKATGTMIAIEGRVSIHASGDTSPRKL